MSHFAPNFVPGRYQVHGSNRPSCAKGESQVSGRRRQTRKISFLSHAVRLDIVHRFGGNEKAADTLAQPSTQGKDNSDIKDDIQIKVVPNSHRKDSANSMTGVQDRHILRQTSRRRHLRTSLRVHKAPTHIVAKFESPWEHPEHR